MNDLVSVIIPTYNRSQFVTEAIDSVLDQAHPNIEPIVAILVLGNIGYR